MTTATNPISTWTFSEVSTDDENAVDSCGLDNTHTCGFAGAFWYARKLARHICQTTEQTALTISMNNGILVVDTVFECYDLTVNVDRVKVSLNSPFFELDVHLYHGASEYFLGRDNKSITLERAHLRKMWKRLVNHAEDALPTDRRSMTGRMVDSLHIEYEGLLNMLTAPYRVHPSTAPKARPYLFFPDYRWVEGFEHAMTSGTAVEFNAALTLLKGVVNHPSLLKGLVTEYKELQIKLSPAVIAWLAENEIGWRVSGNKYILLRDEDYTLYKVMFE